MPAPPASTRSWPSSAGSARRRKAEGACGLEPWPEGTGTVHLTAASRQAVAELASDLADPIPIADGAGRRGFGSEGPGREASDLAGPVAVADFAARLDGVLA